MLVIIFGNCENGDDFWKSLYLYHILQLDKEKLGKLLWKTHWLSDGCPSE